MGEIWRNAEALEASWTEALTPHSTLRCGWSWNVVDTYYDILWIHGDTM